MPASLNLFDTYTLIAILREYAPVSTFFRDRYFGTGEEDIFKSDKVLSEYQNGDQKMAAFVSRRAGDIP
ncbi:MAG: major capsid protein, partial [Lachnospiraceae bacterium]|nr:major capsid protein [Lachnospiraceae bacterium]